VKFFFVHLQKTAGTSLFVRLKRHFDRDAIYPPEDDKGNVAGIISVDHLQQRWRERGDDIEIVTGHFPLCTTELLGGHFVTLTVLRDPVERTLSYLRHHKAMTPADADLPLEEIYEDPFRFHGLVHNHMTKMFSLTVAEMTDGALTRVEYTPERLARAKANLAGVDVLGLQDHFESFCEELQARFGWRLGSPAHTSRTEPVEVPSSFRQRIADDNADDLALWEHAQMLYTARARAYS